LTEHEEVFTSLRVIEEASYIVIRVKASKLHGARGIYDVRRIVNKHGPDFLKSELEALRKLIEDKNIVVLQDVVTIEEIHRTAIEYKLLPRDAVIALTCKHYGIDAILTFDEDLNGYHGLSCMLAYMFSGVF